MTNPNTDDPYNYDQNYERKIAELTLELKILQRAYNELFQLHYGYHPDTKEVIGHVKS